MDSQPIRDFPATPEVALYMREPTFFRVARYVSVVVSWLYSSAVLHPARAEDTLAQLTFFEQRIRPLLIEHCYECHAGEEQSGGLRLDSRSAWQAGGDSGPAIVPGQPLHSRLLEAVSYTNLDLQMPPSGKLSAADIAALEQWISQGAHDPRDTAPNATPADDATATPAPAVRRMSLAEGREFWSMRPLQYSAVPQAADGAWINNPVDAFVLSSLQAHQLSPAPPASRRALIRRVTFDLIGLPPTPAEVEAFVQDASPDAFEKVCERLLASPQYGERWGRHWLDVARYADSNGLDENLAFGNAWRYRDYVVAAFNHDKPFNRFLVEQLAGDLLPSANQETLTATGFLQLGAKVLAEPDREKLFMDTIDEQIDSTGKIFLGMTFGCARCHDHKFDPVTQRDYYALAGFFKSTRTFDGTAMGAIKHWYEHSLADEQELARLKEAEAQIAAKTKAANEFKAKSMSALRSEVQRQAAVYFAIASLCGPQPSLAEAQTLAQPHALHPRVLVNFRVQLELRSEEPVLARWHELVRRQAAPEEIEQLFTRLIKLAESPSANTDQEQPPRPQRDLQQAQRLKALLPQLLVVPVQPEFAFDAQTLAAYYELMDAARIVESSAPDASSVMGVCDGQICTSVPIHIRGSQRNLGEPVARAFPEVMRLSEVPPVFPRHQSGRLELAEWLASNQHPLTARVYVNRIWRWHFGRGLVTTTENFGALGERPTHPELLDWLARYFIESGWSTKSLHRLLLASQTYQQSSEHPDAEQFLSLDPENRWLWKFPLQRLEAEQLRDAMLAVAGQLDEVVGGKTVPLRNRQFVFNHTSQDYTRYDSLRRAMYLPIIRNNLYTLFEQFDYPDATMPAGHRQSTVIATQALLLLNDTLVMDAAQQLAQRICQDFSLPPQRIDWAYQLALGRPADAFEIQLAQKFIERLSVDRNSASAESPHATTDSELRPWALFCQALMASNEFITVE